jgi:hypothetical protein
MYKRLLSHSKELRAQLFVLVRYASCSICLQDPNLASTVVKPHTTRPYRHAWHEELWKRGKREQYHHQTTSDNNEHAGGLGRHGVCVAHRARASSLPRTKRQPPVAPTQQHPPPQRRRSRNIATTCGDLRYREDATTEPDRRPHSPSCHTQKPERNAHDQGREIERHG